MASLKFRRWIFMEATNRRSPICAMRIDCTRRHSRRLLRKIGRGCPKMSKVLTLQMCSRGPFYQTLLKFELSREGAAASTILALPQSVWESWQPFLGRPVIEHVDGLNYRIKGSDNDLYHGTNAWIFVFDLDETSRASISPLRITAKIRVSGTDLIEHAFVNVPKHMLHWATNEDALLQRIRSRI